MADENDFWQIKSPAELRPLTELFVPKVGILHFRCPGEIGFWVSLTSRGFFKLGEMLTRQARPHVCGVVTSPKLTWLASGVVLGLKAVNLNCYGRIRFGIAYSTIQTFTRSPGILAKQAFLPSFQREGKLRHTDALVGESKGHVVWRGQGWDQSSPVPSQPSSFHH